MKDKLLEYSFYFLMVVLLPVLCLCHGTPYFVVFCLSVPLFYWFQRKSAQFIEEKESRIANLESELLDIKQMKNALEEQLWKQKEILLCTNNQVEMELDAHEQARLALFDSDIHKLFREQTCSDGKTTITTHHWKQLDSAINNAYKGFSEKLHKIRDLSEHEFHICLLIKIDIPPVGMAKLTNHTKASISATRRRLYEKIFWEDGSPQKLDEFIRSL
jgi:hypothetical protein